MNKTLKYTINGALIMGFVNGFLNALNQMNNIPKPLKLDWNKILKSAGNGALLGGTVGFVLGKIRDKEMSNVLSSVGGASGYLNKTLESYEFNLYSLENKAERMKSILYEEFKHLLSSYPVVSGSKMRGTSIVGSDIDIHLKFKRDSGSIEYLRELIERYFNSSFHDSALIKVRNQPCSIGLIFQSSIKEYRIDIVPMREIDNGKGDTFLYIKNDLLFGRSTITKTNTKLHVKHLTFTSNQKKVVKLLKGWKKLNSLNMPSIYLELLIKKAYEKVRTTKDILVNLLNVVEFIGNHIVTLYIVDPANTNNVISKYLSNSEKETISQFCFQMIDDIKNDRRNIIDYFPDWE